MTALFLALAAAWLWACLVFADKPMRAAVFSLPLVCLLVLIEGTRSITNVAEKFFTVIFHRIADGIEWIERKLGPVDRNG